MAVTTYKLVVLEELRRRFSPSSSAIMFHHPKFSSRILQVQKFASDVLSWLLRSNSGIR
jgi:hypothetical protein